MRILKKAREIVGFQAPKVCFLLQLYFLGLSFQEAITKV